MPHGTTWGALRAALPVLLAYALSFVYLGIYWNNHHHMLHAVTRVNGADPVGEPAPAVLAVPGPVRDRMDGREPLPPRPDRRVRRRSCSRPLAYSPAGGAAARRGRPIAAARGDRPGRQGQGLAVALLRGHRAAFVDARSASRLYIGVALMWFVPDRRVERRVTAAHEAVPRASPRALRGRRCPTFRSACRHLRQRVRALRCGVTEVLGREAARSRPALGSPAAFAASSGSRRAPSAARCPASTVAGHS